MSVSDLFNFCATYRKIISCGSDGDIRTWVNIHDDDPSSQCIGELTICLDQYDKRMLVSTELNTVQAFTYPEADRENTEFRFTATVTCIKSNEKVQIFLICLII